MPSERTPLRKHAARGALIAAIAIGTAGASTPSRDTLEIRNGTIAGGGGDIAAARYQLTKTIRYDGV